MIKKRQHYVSRYYLKAWTNQKEQINCLRNQEIFLSSLMGVAQERFFYELQNLTKNEIEVVKQLMFNNGNPMLEALNRDWLRIYLTIFELENNFNILNTRELQDSINVLKKNMEEDYHSLIESLGNKYLDLIRKRDIYFYSNEEDRLEFLLYISTQYFRTNNIKQRIINDCKNKYSQIDMQKIYPVLANMFATNVAYGLFIRKKMNLFLLINNTNLEFITGDQPVLNTYGVYKDGKLEDDEFELYSPISPKLAVLISDKNINDKVINISDEDKINEYNKFIVHSSYEQIFATNEKTLLLYKDEVKKEVK